MAGGHAWWGCAWQGGCVVVGACMAGGHAWQILRDTVNERAVRILLECILVFHAVFSNIWLNNGFPLGIGSYGNPGSAPDFNS